MQHAGVGGHDVAHLAGGDVLCGVAQEREHGQAPVLDLLQLVLIVLRRAARYTAKSCQEANAGEGTKEPAASASSTVDSTT